MFGQSGRAAIPIDSRLKYRQRNEVTNLRRGRAPRFSQFYGLKPVFQQPVSGCRFGFWLHLR